MADTNVTTVLTLVQWNAIIDKINIGLANCQNPGASGPSLPHVTAPHVWTLKDVTNAQNALKGSCSPAPTFITPVAPYVWMQKILDELTNAAKACCSGPTGPTGPTGPKPVYWYVVLCDCYGGLTWTDTYCAACVPFTGTGPGVANSGVFKIVGLQAGWSTAQFPNAQALATAWAASANAGEYYSGSNGPIPIKPFQVHSVPVGTPPIVTGPCPCS